MDFSRQPLAGSDVAAFVFGVLAFLFVVLWWRDRERGTLWLAVAYALFTVQFAWDAATLPSGLFVNPVTGTVLNMAGAAFNGGMLRYLSSPGRPSRGAFMLAVLPPLVIPVVLLLGVPVTRMWGYVPYVLGAVVVIKVAVEAARREPRAGFPWVAVGLLSIPVFGLVAWQQGPQMLFYLRYFLVLPFILFGMMVLTASLLRKRQQLEAENARRRQAEEALTSLNASLEQAIASRTADLQSIVSGLESFNRDVSHDLRGSLSGMSSLARAADEALQQDDVSVARRVLPLLATQAQRSSELLSALLTLARVGDHQVRKTTVDLNVLIREAIASVSMTRPAAGMPRFIFGELPLVHADGSLLRPALLNLIDNAVKFCGYRPDGCVEITAQADAVQGVVRIRDNGIGFSRDQVPELFQPFSQLHGSSFGGHGIGLNIVRRAIERQGGSVWAEAEPDKGASFYFSLLNEDWERAIATEKTVA